MLKRRLACRSVVNSKCTSLALWNHHVNLLLQNFRSVSSDLHHAVISKIHTKDVL